MGKYKSLISSVKTVLLNEEKPVNLDEGRMGEFHALIKRGTPAEQIAKVMKLDLKTIKALMPKSGRPAGRPVDEELTPAQSKKKEEIVLSMKKKKKEFQDRYGDEWESVMHATATKMSKESIELGELRRAKYPKGDPKAGEYADPRTHKDTFYVKWAKAKRDKITVEPFKTLAKAKARLADVRKKGFNGIISQGGKPVKESVELDELRRDVYVITDKKGKVVAAKLTKDNAHKEISRHRGGTIVLDPDAKVGQVLKKFIRKESVELDEVIKPSTGYAVVLHGKVVEKGNKKNILRKVKQMKKENPKLTRDDLFIGVTTKPIGAKWPKSKRESVEMDEQGEYAPARTSIDAMSHTMAAQTLKPKKKKPKEVKKEEDMSEEEKFIEKAKEHLSSGTNFGSWSEIPSKLDEVKRKAGPRIKMSSKRKVGSRKITDRETFKKIKVTNKEIKDFRIEIDDYIDMERRSTDDDYWKDDKKELENILRLIIMKRYAQAAVAWAELSGTQDVLPPSLQKKFEKIAYGESVEHELDERFAGGAAVKAGIQKVNIVSQKGKKYGVEVHKMGQMGIELVASDMNIGVAEALKKAIIKNPKLVLEEIKKLKEVMTEAVGGADPAGGAMIKAIEKARKIIAKKTGTTPKKLDSWEYTSKIMKALNVSRGDPKKAAEVYLKQNESVELGEVTRPMGLSGKFPPRGKFSKSQLDKLRDAYGKIGKINPETNAYKNLVKLLDSLDKQQIKQLVDAKIPFVSSLAFNRFNRMQNPKNYPSGKLGESVELDEKHLLGKTVLVAGRKGTVTKFLGDDFGREMYKVKLEDGSTIEASSTEMESVSESASKSLKPSSKSEKKKVKGHQHDCAIKVEHADFGRGTCVKTQHAEPDEKGNVAWYDVLFEHGVERKVPIEDLNVLLSEYHSH